MARAALLLLLSFAGCSLLAPSDDHFMGARPATTGMNDDPEHAGAGGQAFAGEGPGGSDTQAGASSTDGGQAGSDGRGGEEADAGAGPGACSPGFVADAGTCRRPTSCAELHRESPSLDSGVYTLRPTLAPSALSAWCEMRQQGGGWTLILNQGTDFLPSTEGTPNAICLESNCTSSAYSWVTLESDILLDVAEVDIVADDYDARIAIVGVHPDTRDRTLREAFTTGPYFLESADNSNVAVTTTSGLECDQVLPLDLAAVLCLKCSSTSHTCGAPILTLGDGDSACSAEPPLFAIGASESDTEPWTNCAGWPQTTTISSASGDVFRYYPSHFRIWLR